MQAGSARYHLMIEINYLHSFANSILYLLEYKHIYFYGRGGTIYKEMKGHDLDDMISNPGRGVVLMLKLGLTQLPFQLML
jgi:hypothetical protein